MYVVALMKCLGQTIPLASGSRDPYCYLQVASRLLLGDFCHLQVASRPLPPLASGVATLVPLASGVATLVPLASPELHLNSSTPPVPYRCCGTRLLLVASTPARSRCGEVAVYHDRVCPARGRSMCRVEGPGKQHVDSRCAGATVPVSRPAARLLGLRVGVRARS
jgi:hypothetical protein